MSQFDPLFQPLTIKGLVLKNRFLSTSHAPGYTQQGNITERYIHYEAEKAKGGVGLLQFGGATSVAIEGSYHYGQINGSVDDVIPQYRRIAEAIHAHGAACTVQLRHGGRQEHWDHDRWLPAFSPSPTRELNFGVFAAEMEDHDIVRAQRDFVAAVGRARDGDIDGVEIACQSGALIEQFWSPAMNYRTDRYGGSLANRMRFGLEVLEAIRKAIGEDYIVGIRMPGDEMLQGGLNQDDCIAIAEAYAGSGLIDFISVVGAQPTDTLSIARIWPTMWVPTAAYLPLAAAIKAVSAVPIFHATRITDAATAVYAVREGLVDMVGMTRAFIADPHHVKKLENGDQRHIRPCIGAGYCVDRVISGADALCVHNVATSREQQLPHVITPVSSGKRSVVVIGGGPGGLEAARVCASRGHQVILYEAAAEPGGQIVLAAKATWRSGLIGIATWLADQLDNLGVDVRCNRLADQDTVLESEPDIVIIATGGTPTVGHFEGKGLANTVWDMLAGHVECAGDILIVDESGGHAALSCAEFAADQGAQVQIVSPDRMLGTKLAQTNLGAHLSELYKLKVRIRPDTRLEKLEREDDGLTATLANVFTESKEHHRFDQVIGEHGTSPNSDLYFTLKPFSTNLGEVDLESLARAQPQTLATNPDGRFSLYRIGDAWASRNIHAAMLDAMRLCLHF
jgi:2,4-dienoyl-CoA reductase-like NADH-dependent reductase (Old Yellow Enzyme family)/thioredoxin reductase